MQLKTRGLTLKDLEFIRKIHEEFFPTLEFPDFENGWLNAFVIENEKDEILIAGGLKATAEGYLVTNRNQPSTALGRALLEAQNISLFTCRRYGISELFAFTHDEGYSRHLIEHGFIHREGKPLSLKVL